MKAFILALSILIFSACGASLEDQLDRDPRYNAGTDPSTLKPIPVKFYRIDGFLFAMGYSKEKSSIGMYFNDEELYFKSSADGYFDTVALRNINYDHIPDFLFEEKHEDGTSVYALVSSDERKFICRKIGENIPMPDTVVFSGLNE